MYLNHILNIKLAYGKLTSISPHFSTHLWVINKLSKCRSKCIRILNWNYKSIFTVNHSITTTYRISSNDRTANGLRLDYGFRQPLTVPRWKSHNVRLFQQFKYIVTIP